MIKNLETEHFDLICIGSGMGSLTVASLLAQDADKKVLIVEKHFQPGGYTHCFQRKRSLYHWDVGISYVGGLATVFIIQGYREILKKILK
ncbi:MAG: NAD(P)-binding protein [Leptospiraceae bacterium]|nr:NAD(P)-binding protein [Leptospiraceae bacterium]MCZ8346802.1 NAD(P)-binding protein [Leptospiraceae bacterium]